MASALSSRLEKGIPGNRVFEDALLKWNSTEGAAISVGAQLPLPVGRSVKTSTIRLDPIDRGLQLARERVALGDITGARAIMERFTQSDPRVLVGLAMT
jgi:hypothetical protein